MIMYLYMADSVYICFYIVYIVTYVHNGPESSSVGKFESLPKDKQTEPDHRLQVWLKCGFTRHAFHGSFGRKKVRYTPPVAMENPTILMVFTREDRDFPGLC